MNRQASTALDQGLLLVEDTPSLQMLYQTVLRKAGYPPICASNGKEALAKFEEVRPGVVLLDLMLPDMDGMMVMHEMLSRRPETLIIVISANGSINKAVEATRKGAHDFLVKPLGDLRLVGAVSNALSEARARGKTPSAGTPSVFGQSDVEFLGGSEVMQRLRSKIRAVARSMAPVFILGESGTGKKTCAHMIHMQSQRADKAFVTVNCSAKESVALETELFGPPHQRGKTENPVSMGAIQRAEDGTLLLVNPQDLPAELQARLLTTLQTATRVSFGKRDPVQVDLRLICASSKDPTEEMRAGRLSEELYYRLFVIPLIVPPLRERGADISLLAQSFLRKIAQQEGKNFTRLSETALDVLHDHPWQGNLRELINVLRHAIVLHDGPELTEAMLPDELMVRAERARPAGHPAAPAVSPEEALRGLTIAEIEQRVIMAAITRNGGSIPRAAHELDIAPSTIYRKRDGWTKQTR